MTSDGEIIHSITIEQVRDQLSEESDPKAIKRLTAVREYLAGHSPAEIETKYGWAEDTVYGWLYRFQDRDFEDALYDDKPPGREPKLTDSEFQQFGHAVNAEPAEAGYDEPVWTTQLAQTYLLETFEVSYSQRHVRRLLHQAGLSRQKPRPQPASADPAERDAFQEEAQKK